ncbi:hypothetical protein WN51_03471 [Melipona quadrifasciata]|uniref:Uncharacterized protein n=1 Tax=Melipona quadrifasciata TaxID=166423 RepID=A0A0M8ZUI4_9HYME|nr:hypothetical protein WN51_03471 [Melipona quadrifasciata]
MACDPSTGHQSANAKSFIAGPPGFEQIRKLSYSCEDGRADVPVRGTDTKFKTSIATDMFIFYSTPKPSNTLVPSTKGPEFPLFTSKSFKSGEEQGETMAARCRGCVHGPFTWKRSVLGTAADPSEPAIFHFCLDKRALNLIVLMPKAEIVAKPEIYQKSSKPVNKEKKERSLWCVVDEMQ